MEMGAVANELLLLVLDDTLNILASVELGDKCRRSESKNNMKSRQTEL